MDDKIFNIILLCIPVIGAIITTFIIPYIQTKISSMKTDEITKWVTKAVEAAEVLFNEPKSGEKKRDYVIDLIDSMFNTKKEVITRDQIRILLESSWKNMIESK